MKTTRYALSVDYSGPQPSMALHGWDGKSIGGLVATLPAGRQILEAFIPELKHLLEIRQVALHEIGVFVTTSGPGSFTGLRCCLASLKALSRVGGQNLATVAADEIRALAWLDQAPTLPQRLRVVTQISHAKAVILTYECHTRTMSRSVANAWTPLPNEATLLSQNTELGLLPNTPHTHYFPCRAAFVGTFFDRAQSAATAATLISQSQLEPEYFSDRWGAHLSP